MQSSAKNFAFIYIIFFVIFVIVHFDGYIAGVLFMRIK
jgi:hypothetical protein